MHISREFRRKEDKWKWLKFYSNLIRSIILDINFQIKKGALCSRKNGILNSFRALCAVQSKHLVRRALALYFPQAI